jgi:type II secretory pathway component GspD/PulD (secretin)
MLLHYNNSNKRVIHMSADKGQTADVTTAFKEKAELVIYAENQAAVEVAQQIVAQLDNQNVNVQVRRGQAPLLRGSWGC